MRNKSRRICGDGLAERIKSVGQSTEEVRNRIDVVLFSGGSGTQSITEALLAHPQIHLHILINAYDDGLSTGRLREVHPRYAWTFGCAQEHKSVDAIDRALPCKSAIAIRVPPAGGRGTRRLTATHE